MKCELLLVVDGDRNSLKSEENTERQKSAIDAKNMLKKIAENNEDINLDIVHRLVKQSVSVSPLVVSSLKVYCQSKNYELHIKIFDVFFYKYISFFILLPIF